MGTRRIWHRMVSVGDSFTEGLEDPDPDLPGAYRGWADRLALALAEAATGPAEPMAGDPPDEADHHEGRFEYANLAVRGRLLADIVGPQLDAALTMEPDLVTIVGGGNDILRPRADVQRLAEQLDHAVARARAAGADVLLATPVLPSGAPVIRWTSGRVGIYTAHINTIARRHGAYLIDQWAQPVLQTARVWAPDRIHLAPQGHEIVTLLALAALGVVGDDGSGSGVDGADLTERCERIAAGADQVELGLRSNLTWARTYAGPWVGRRLRGRSSGDQVRSKRPTPELIRRQRLSSRHG